MDFQKLPVTPLIGADPKTFDEIVRGRVIDKGFKKKYHLTRAGSGVLSMYLPFERRKYRKLERKPLEMDPFFIIGHWRCGTTFVHNVFACDKHFGYNTTYQTVLPNQMLFGQPFFRKCLSMAMPTSRPTDNLELGVNLPQEEEFALTNMMPYTYYNFWYLPKHTMEYCERFLLFNTITEAERKIFKETFLKLVKIALWNTNGVQFLSKNPPHTGRIKTLLEMFPNAKFLYLKRNPYTVFESTRSFFTNTIQPLRLQDITNEEIEQNAVEIFKRLYYKYEEEKHMIPLGNLVEIKFEDFEADAFAMTEDIYSKLDLPGFNESKANIEAYLSKKKGYKKNNYTYDDRTLKIVNENWDMALKGWGY
ncbi:hypothetical protein M2459_001075 [Parabacteroides sp. PF5-5]|uniref:sulfotransferase family protein n=1 Tax=unclassified Parabacteroides TaxID=2649774 RepID=UPI0024730941|nr:MULTISPECIES: sulfotransferase [unclassified Parabacteroides]MDH6304343.1 hypothetical protein [Parabacteroides sp. PH5-39]MDH6315504.1 hypothetical protein [Parabacteroides sp. PF5-13]MDH6319002.1 hypothetical protein [Parabacteroides sp. PH5-13]MDH6322731.1 hypothetical protein [Parabacteroides sp. PH5-8]MDH6326697.1 hypothetical protein [Parabacteroides sp. PH5-41]